MVQRKFCVCLFIYAIVNCRALGFLFILFYFISFFLQESTKNAYVEDGKKIFPLFFLISNRIITHPHIPIYNMNGKIILSDRFFLTVVVIVAFSFWKKSTSQDFVCVCIYNVYMFMCQYLCVLVCVFTCVCVCARFQIKEFSLWKKTIKTTFFLCTVIYVHIK